MFSSILGHAAHDRFGGRSDSVCCVLEPLGIGVGAQAQRTNWRQITNERERERERGSRATGPEEGTRRDDTGFK